jgi:hypothetical protein
VNKQQQRDAHDRLVDRLQQHVTVRRTEYRERNQPETPWWKQWNDKLDDELALRELVEGGAQ